MSEELAALERAALSTGATGATGATGDRDALAVYADALQAAHDPRGELIAIDLHADAHGPSEELDRRRARLAATWLGEPLAEDPQLAIRHGYVELELEPPGERTGIAATGDPLVLARLLASPGAPYLRALVVHGNAELIGTNLALLAAETRPRLVRLAVHAGPMRTSPIQQLAGALRRSLPELDTLVVRGDRVFPAFPHPRLRRLRVGGFAAFASLAGAGSAMPALEELDFSVHRNLASGLYPLPTVAQLGRMLRGVPALRRLDLSRNEPVPAYGYLAQQVFEATEFLRELAIKRQLTHLRMPALLENRHVAQLQASLDRMPALAELEVVRLALGGPQLDGDPPPLHHPSARIVVPGPSEWGPRTHQRGRDAICVEIRGHPYGIVVDLAAAVRLMEERFQQMPSPTRAAWERLWHFLDTVPLGEGAIARSAFPATTLAEALAMPELDDAAFVARVAPGLAAWRTLRDVLAVRARFAVPAMIRRHYGW